MSITDDQLVDLLLIPGIGRAKARVLYAQGFRSLKDLAECPFEELSEIPGIGSGLASSIKEYAEVMLDVDEDSSDKLETSTGLSMCPMCGSLLAEGAEKCLNCGVVFELEDEEMAPSPEFDPDAPDGYWSKKEETQIYLCPECGALISEDATECGKCGVAFEPGISEPEPEMDKEVKELADMLVTETPDDVDAQRYKSETELFLCPNCGSFLSADANTCQYCGVVFEDDDEEIEAKPELKPDGVGEPDAPDVPIEHVEEETQIFLCTECGAFISEDATECSICGVALEPAVDEPTPEKQKSEEVEELMGMLVKKAEEHHNGDPDVDGFWYRKEAQLFLCPECGAFISEDATNCEKCGTKFEAEDTEAKPESLLAKQPEIVEAPEAPEVPTAAEAEEPDELLELVLDGEIEGVEAEPVELDIIHELEQFEEPPVEDEKPAQVPTEEEPAKKEMPDIFEEDNELKELAEMLINDESLDSDGDGEGEVDKDIDGHWYKKEAELFLCPSCGSFLTSGVDHCEHCGVIFEGEDEEIEAAPELKPDSPDLPDILDAPDAPIEQMEEETQFFLCTECGALMSKEATQCANCGTVYEPGAEEPEPEIDDETRELEDMLVTRDPDDEPPADDVDGHWHRKDVQLYLCPSCGSFLASDADNCDHCGVVF